MLGLAVDEDLLGIVKLHLDRPVAAISYILRADAWGHGYATQGVRKILTLAFGHLRLPEVRAKHHPDNHASGRVLRKSGFVPTGEQRGFMTYAAIVGPGSRPRHQFEVTGADSPAASLQPLNERLPA